MSSVWVCLIASLYLSIVVSLSVSNPSTAYAADLKVCPPQESVQSKLTGESLSSTIAILVESLVIYKAPCESFVSVTAVFADVLVSVSTAVVDMFEESHTTPSPSISWPKTDSFLPMDWDQDELDQSITPEEETL